MSKTSNKSLRIRDGGRLLTAFRRFTKIMQDNEYLAGIVTLGACGVRPHLAIPGEPISIGEVARRLRFSERTVKSWYQDGTLRATRIKLGGGRVDYKVTEEDYAHFLNLHAAIPPAMIPDFNFKAA